MSSTSPTTHTALPQGSPGWKRQARLARLLSWLSLVYMAAEGAIAVTAAIIAESVALLGFGLDSVIEGLASIIIVWRFTGARTLSQTAERRAQKAVAVTFFLQQAAPLGWVEVATRRGDATVSVLRPVDASAAHPKSLSANYGLGQQPLHTDGAHLPDPPDLVVLVSQRPSSTPTWLWRPATPVPWQPTIPSVALRHGMFLVRNGRDSFYAPALSGSRYRYDPGCMTACDARAREVEQYFMKQLAEATTHEWSGAGQVLVVDNRRVLHARSAMTKDDLDRELTRVAFSTEAAQ